MVQWAMEERAMRISMLSIAASLSLASTCFADTWTVDDDGKADFDNIQAAVDAASDGDEILVHPGTYSRRSGGPDNTPVVRIEGKSIHLIGLQGPQTTIINGQGEHRGVVCGGREASDTIIEGMSFTDGYTDDGAGIYCNHSSPTLINCIIEGNMAYSNGGGGVYCWEASPTLIECVLTNNTASGTPGGGIYSNGGLPHLVNTLVCGNYPDQVNGPWTDGGGNTLLDDCPCEGDATDDGHVDIYDLLIVISTWGTSGPLGDVNYDGIVNVHDLLAVIDTWGACD